MFFCMIVNLSLTWHCSQQCFGDDNVRVLQHLFLLTNLLDLLQKYYVIISSAVYQHLIKLIDIIFILLSTRLVVSVSWHLVNKHQDIMRIMGIHSKGKRKYVFNIAKYVNTLNALGQHTVFTERTITVYLITKYACKHTTRD